MKKSTTQHTKVAARLSTADRSMLETISGALATMTPDSLAWTLTGTVKLCTTIARRDAVNARRRAARAAKKAGR